jgi:hypothetical protein
MSRPAREGEASCAIHEGMESVGACARCQRYICETCRTTWRGDLCCAACVDRALGSDEASPEQERAHSRQARASLLMGGGAWLAALLLLLASRPLAGRVGPAGGSVLAFTVLAVVLVNVVLAGAGVGQGVAALRGRGDRGPAAVVGIVLGGLYAGVVMGMGLFYLWQS